MAPLYRALYEGGADVALAGHARHYERFAPQTSVGRSPAFGIRQFVVGTGGLLAGPDRRRQEEQRGARELHVRRAGADAPAGRLLVALHRARRARPSPTPAAAAATGSRRRARGRRSRSPSPAPEKGKTKCTVLGTPGQRRAARHQRARRDLRPRRRRPHRRQARQRRAARRRRAATGCREATGATASTATAATTCCAAGAAATSCTAAAATTCCAARAARTGSTARAAATACSATPATTTSTSPQNGNRDTVNGGRGRDRAKAQRHDKVRGVERVIRR